MQHHECMQQGKKKSTTRSLLRSPSHVRLGSIKRYRYAKQRDATHCPMLDARWTLLQQRGDRNNGSSCCLAAMLPVGPELLLHVYLARCTCWSQHFKSLLLAIDSTAQRALRETGDDLESVRFAALWIRRHTIPKNRQKGGRPFAAKSSRRAFDPPSTSEK